MTQNSQKWKENLLRTSPFIPESYNRFLKTDILRCDISAVTFLDNTEGAFCRRSWNVGSRKDRPVSLWAEPDGKLCHVYIAADGGINGVIACAYLFCNCSNLREVNFNSCFHTACPEDVLYKNFFGGTSRMHVNSSNVSMQFMFYGCSSLVSVDLSELDLSYVTSTDCMFGKCVNLRSVNLNGCKISRRLQNMTAMFRDCTSLTTLDLSQIDLSSKPTIDNIFDGCTGLQNDPWTKPSSAANTSPASSDSSRPSAPAKTLDFSHVFKTCAVPQTSRTAQARENKKYVLIDELGNRISPRQWDWMGEFREGFALAKENDRLELIDTNGTVCVPPDEWDEITDFFNGFAKVRKNTGYTFIGHSCTPITPCEWEDVRLFREGAAAVKANGRWGYIDTSGKLIIPCTWDAVSDFFDGNALADTPSGTCLIDRSGNILKNSAPISAANFVSRHDDMRFKSRCAFLHDAPYSGRGLVDMAGNEIIRHTFDRTYAYVGDRQDSDLLEINVIIGTFQHSYFYADTTGKEFHPYPWSWMEPFREGMAVVRASSTAEFQPIGTPPYYRPYYFDRSYMPYPDNEEDYRMENTNCSPTKITYGYINYDGELVIPCEFDFAESFHDGYARVKKDGKSLFIDKTGKIIIPGQPNPDVGMDFFKYPVKICENGRYGFIHADGRKLTEYIWENVSDFSEGYAAVMENGLWGILDSSGSLCCPCRWEWIGSFHKRNKQK